jgi:tetratricopeptide (TPR) repeat protein
LLINHRICFTVFILTLFLCLAAAGCRSTRMAGRPDAPPKVTGVDIEDSQETEEPEESRITEPSSRIRAARDINLKAAGLLDKNKPDAAIDLLERAIAIDPSNGETYYYLSRAWLMKGDKEQAYEFNRLAEIYMEDDGDWHRQVQEQKALIQEP